MSTHLASKSQAAAYCLKESAVTCFTCHIAKRLIPAIVKAIIALACSLLILLICILTDVVEIAITCSAHKID